VRCAERRVPLHAHHLIEASFLRREFKNVVDPLRMAAIQYDVRNQIGLCEDCHANHHAGMKSPLRSAHVPESAWEFARELDQFTGTEKFTVRLERYREAFVTSWHASDSVGYRPIARVQADSHDEAASRYIPLAAALFLVRDRGTGHVIAFNAIAPKPEPVKYKIQRAARILAV
jgi:hypothetical protein